MDTALKDKFTELWKKYFNAADLPITFYYSAEATTAEFVKPGSTARCLIGALAQVRKGRSFTFDASSIGCPGGRKYLGFAETIRPNFEYFLSSGLPGKMEGERYKKSPELAREIMSNWPSFKAPKPLVIFKRWDNLDKNDNPEVVIFFALPDVLSGLYTLANFDDAGPNAVITPMGSGCSSIVTNPYLEKDLPHPRGVIGMFDPSARPFVARDELSFSVPMNKFLSMVDNIEESFLITHTWNVLQKRAH